MYKKRNDPKFYVGPVWDFDLAFENDNRTYPINNKTCYIYQWVNSSSAGTMDVLVERIVVNDTRTAGDLLEMWSATRSNGLSGESLCDFVDKWAAEMDASQRLNFMRWDILNTKVHENPQASGSYEGEVAWVKNYLRERIAWMDNKIGYDPSSVGNIGIETEELLLSEVAEWRVYNVGGQEVYSVDGELSTTSLLPGIYIVKGVAADNRSVTTKIVVK